MKNRLIFTISLITALCVLSSDAFARITVVSVKGSVAYKTGRNWVPLSRGMGLKEGVKISTGVRSYAVLKLNRNTMRIRPLTMIKIYENRLTKNSSRTRIALKRGSLRARVEKGKRVRTVFRVSTPVATSSVRGTEPDISYGPGRGFRTHAITGTVEGQSKSGSRKNVTGRQEFRQRSGNPESEGILAGARGNAFGSVHDRNVSGDENDSFGGNSDLEDDAGSGSVETVDANVGSGLNLGDVSPKTSTVNVNVTWP